MSRKFRWILLIINLIVVYGLGYFLYINIATGKPIFGVIPEFLVYIICGYFITSILIEVLVGESFSNIKKSIVKALILLLFFIIFTLIYWLFYKYVILFNELQNTFIGEKSYLVFLMIMIFLGIRFANKLYYN